MKFEELDIPEAVRQGIRAAGFTECTPVQAMTLPEALRGKDIAAQAQTGTGKTAAYLIGIFSRMLTVPSSGRGPSPRALIVAPTRELVVQIDAEANVLGGSTGFRMVPVFGGIDYEKQRSQIASGVDVLIGTPGRLIDYLKQKVYSLKKTQFLVIDEADRMFDMGFISDLRFLLRRMSPYDQRQSMLFSATLSHRVMELSYEYMNMPKRFVVTPEQLTVELTEQQIYHVGKGEKFGLLLHLIGNQRDSRFLIFCNMKVTAERLKRALNANSIATAAITGDLPQKKRMKVLSDFKDGKFPVLVATDVASRGLHIEGVTHVVNYDLPQDPQDYVHRIGRTGRAGAGGTAISLASEDDIFSLPDIERYIKEKISVIPITDEMIVSDYKKAASIPHKKSIPPDKRRLDRKTWRMKKSSGEPRPSRQSEKSRGDRPRGKKPGAGRN